MKGKSRKLSHFIISPPDVGQYYLKVYAKPEGEIMSENDTLDHVATFLIHTIQVKIDYSNFIINRYKNLIANLLTLCNIDF